MSDENPQKSALPDRDAGPMDPASRSLLVGLLFAFSLIFLYGLGVLWSVDFDQSSGKPLTAWGTAPTMPALRIEEIRPQAVTVGRSALKLIVRGQNFGPGAKVYINGIPRETTRQDWNTLFSQLTPEDAANPGSIAISVLQGTNASPPYFMEVVPLTRSKGDVRLTPIGPTLTIDEETRLLLLVLLAGALGSYLHSIRSLVDYIGNRTLTASWFWFYLTRPPIGMALALVFYAVIRGGFLVGTPADAKSVNSFGVIALSALVGMFADKASQKLSEIFETLFKTADRRTDDLQPLTIVTRQLPEGKVGTAYGQTLQAAGGTPEYRWEVAPLPDGLELKAGTIIGTPTQAGETPVVVTVTDRKNKTAQAKQTLKIT
jgi:hypothetical protein